ncbi:DUF2493 domain-containing protein [Streptomyces sp. NBC_00490]|uniref:DUF2493 domain-containing protein n=1 Tax=Streptomyces sp. NBC_00490 TaxID=2903657 RepID=UPI002E1912C7
MRVIVRGSATWTDRGAVFETLNRLYLQHGPFVLVHGAGATGSDDAAHVWMQTAGRDLGCFEVPHPADFEKHGKAARSIRDKALTETGADLAVVFSTLGDEESKQVVDLATEAGIPVQEIAA